MDNRSTGLTSIDDEHQWILKSLKSMRSAIAGNDHMDVVQKTMSILLDAFVVHCSHEEECALEMHGDGSPVCRLGCEHAKLRAFFLELKGNVLQRQVERDELLRMLDDLEGHVLAHIEHIDVPILRKVGHIASLPSDSPEAVLAPLPQPGDPPKGGAGS